LSQAPFFFVLNPGSGHDDSDRVQQTVAAVLDEAGRAHRFLRARSGAELPAAAAQAVANARAQGGIVVAVGGDGTINAVVNQVLGSGCVMGVLPQGTFNYFGRTHGIPEDPAEAARLLLTASPQPVQVGMVNDHAFLVNASVGLYPQLLEDREAYKQRFGRRRWVAWWSAAVTLLQAHRPLRLALSSGGQTRHVRTPTLFVGNNALQLSQIGIAEAPALSEGALVAIMVRPVGTLAMAWLMLRGAVGQLGEARDVMSFAFETLSVQPAAPLGHRRLKVATDGEVLRTRAPLVFRVAPQPLMLLKPPPAREAA
jgi:diacylglycerol kinase family enzyme